MSRRPLAVSVDASRKAWRTRKKMGLSHVKQETVMRVRKPYSLDRRPRVSERAPWRIEFKDGSFSIEYRTRQEARDDLRRVKRALREAPGLTAETRV